MKYQAVGFDMGGVIIEYSVPDVITHIAQNLDRPLRQVQQAFSKFRPLLERGEIDNLEFWTRLTREINAKGDPKKTKHLWNDNYIEYNPILPGMLELVDKLKDCGYKVGLLSNIDEEHAEINRARGIYEHFGVVLLSEEIGTRKPEPTAYRRLAKELKVELNELVFVDDLPENAVGANLAGCYGIEFHGHKSLVAQLKELGFKI